MEDLAVFTALNHSGSFGKNFAEFKKNKYVIYRLRVVPPSRQITYIYFTDKKRSSLLMHFASSKFKLIRRANQRKGKYHKEPMRSHRKN